MSAWNEYKKKLGSTRPWDVLDPNTEWTKKEISDSRFDICSKCPELIKLSKQCKQCGCFMPLKVKMKLSECPIGKW